MLTYFKAEIYPSLVIKEGVTEFRIETIVDGKKISYIDKLNNDILVADGFLGYFMHQVKIKLSHEINLEREKCVAAQEKEESGGTVANRG